MDIATITTALGGIKSATEIAKFLNGANGSRDKAETKLKIAELITALADAKIAIADIQGIILEKDQQIRELEEAQKLKGSVKYEIPCYWVYEGNEKGGPYCQKCYDAESQLIRVQFISRTNKGDVWSCFSCKSRYVLPEDTMEKVQDMA